eukprot:TRINITY_DN13277_c2_g1_i1.p1 TRINITY_DN13277_c2_g1~~TRINITY_DN13277_c2_g1_i1.p1  ORF type:complete len:367 (+),score=78.17 TRINITY_DN13277_c2_g1_i1:70-1101(+)
MLNKFLGVGSPVRARSNTSAPDGSGRWIKEKLNLVVNKGQGAGFRYEWDSTNSTGVMVLEVLPGGAADCSGLKAGNTIISMCDKKMTDIESFLQTAESIKSKGGCFPIEILKYIPKSTTPPPTPTSAVKKVLTKPRSATQPPSSSTYAFFSTSLTRPLLKNKEDTIKEYSSCTPYMFEIVCPEQPDVQGTYKWDGESKLNGEPIWKSNEKSLYCTRSGLWALVDVKDGPQKNIALVSCSQPAKKRHPHHMHWGVWQCWDGAKWLPCPVRIEELRIDPADGQAYWKGAFIEYYGAENGLKSWDAAAFSSNKCEDLSNDDLSPPRLHDPDGADYIPPVLPMIMEG